MVEPEVVAEAVAEVVAEVVAGLVGSLITIGALLAVGLISVCCVIAGRFTWLNSSW